MIQRKKVYSMYTDLKVGMNLSTPSTVYKWCMSMVWY